MGLFDSATSEQIHRDQVQVDEREGAINVDYGQDQSVNSKVQNQVQNTLLAELIFSNRRQNALLEEQNELLERQNQLLEERSE
jgi:hypothetical protein